MYNYEPDDDEFPSSFTEEEKIYYKENYHPIVVEDADCISCIGWCKEIKFANPNCVTAIDFIGIGPLNNMKFTYVFVDYNDFPVNVHFISSDNNKIFSRNVCQLNLDIINNKNYEDYISFL